MNLATALRSTCCAALLALTAPPLLGSDQPEEYLQARKLALRDPKVQAAFAKANERLEQRILEIDPSLRSYVQQEKAGRTTSSPDLEPAPATSLEPVKHVVVKGETLSSIARRYKTSVARLKEANGITNERKLRVGQTLFITSGASNPQSSRSEEHATWGKIKPNF
jgi:nucleoid-associated protein YgaU